MNNGYGFFLLGFLWSTWEQEKEDKKRILAELSYQNKPTAGMYFEKAGWMSYTCLKNAYANTTADKIRDEFESFLKLKNMNVEERAEHTNNPEVLRMVNKMSFTAIKARRDDTIMEMVLFQKNREEVAKHFGVRLHYDAAEDDSRAVILGWFLLGVIAVLFMLIAIAQP